MTPTRTSRDRPDDAPSDPDLPASYEQARTELATIVRALEGGTRTLEESLALWERGEALAALCERWLQAARQRLAAAQDGTATRTDGAEDDEDADAEDDDPAGT